MLKFYHLILIILSFSYSYEVGETISMAHQNADYTICYAPELDPNNEVALEDLHDIEKKDGLAERVKMAEAEKKTEKNNTSSQESESSFCENCGNTLNPKAKFCGSCGTPRA